MKIPLQHVLDRAKHRPDGYVAEILAAAGIPSGATVLAILPPESVLSMPDESYDRLCAKYRPEIPGLLALATDYPAAVAPWLNAGYPVLAEGLADARADTCGLCDELRLKDGKLTCRAYGCSPLKFWLKSTPCLFAKWPSSTPV